MTRHWVRGALALLMCASMHLAHAEATPSEQGAVAIPFKRELVARDQDFSRMIIALLVCGAVLGGALYVLRRRLGPQRRPMDKNKLIRIVDMQRVAPRSMLYVVEFGQMHYLLAHSEQGIACVASSALVVPTGMEKT